MTLRTLSVVVLEARGLLAADKGGTSDPFAEIKLLDKHEKKAISGESAKTKKIKKTLAPVWKETFVLGKKGASLDVTPSHQPYLQVVVYDSDMMSSEELGICTIDLANINQVG
jgi:phosphatidylserine decarboxylase